MVRHFGLAPERRAHVLRAAAAVSLIIGYADLARGGTVMAPLFLVAGYLVLIPVALLTR
jgi:hypothetical protein